MQLGKLVLGSMSVGAAALDADGTYVSINDEWRRLLRFDKSYELVGRSHFDVCRNFLRPADLAKLAGGEIIRDQMLDLGPSQDGDERDSVLRWSASPASEDGDCCDGKACYVVILRRFAQPEEETKRLLRERDQLRFAVDGADYGLWDWNIATGEVYFSQRYMGMLGYEQYELPHAYSTWEHLVKPEDLVEYNAAVEDYIAAGKGFLQDEFEMRRKDGRFIWVLSRGKIVSRRRDGSPLRIVGTHQDITELKEREADLVAAKEEADKANQAKSNFLALISHEVRTPLNGITSVLQLLGEEDDAEERKRLAQLALNSSDQLLTVLSDVLDVSKMEAGRFDLNPKPVKIDDLIEELSQTHAKAAEQKGLKFSTDVKGDGSLILEMDPVRVTQILNNYLSNATKFTEQGEVELSVEIDESYGGGGKGKVFVSFAVRDDGAGLTPSERGKLFQPFYQAEGTRSRSSEGTGLGLSICKNLAAMMGGKVWCASKKDFGSTFYFEAAFERAALASGDADTDADRIDAVDASSIRVLAAEDNPVNQMMLKKFLIDKFGYQVTTVGDGQEVIETLANGAFDIILMDIHMPTMDGVTAARKIRKATPDWSKTPIIALTADAADMHVEEYLGVGMNDCVAKPINWPELDKKIKALSARPSED